MHHRPLHRGPLDRNGPPPRRLSRRAWLAAVAAFAGCAKQAPPAGFPPPALAGGWTRQAVEQVALDQAPEAARKLGLLRAARAVYQGPAGSVTLTLYEMSSGAGAFELVQKQQPKPGAIAFHQGKYFCVAESPALGNPALNAFAAAAEKQLAAPAIR